MSQRLQREKKTAIKILNKYADSYNNLVEENKSLQAEIKDLRANVKLNKEILSDLMSSMTKSSNSNKNSLSSNSFKSVYNKINQELSSVYEQNEKLSKERNFLREKILHYEENFSESLNKLKEENENYKNKVFLLEQIIYKKNNIITSLKEKISKIKDNSMYEKELYIIDPSKAVVEINDELLLYKKIYNKLIKAIQKSRISKARYETMVEELQRENTKLKRKYHLTIVSANRERETILSVLSQNTRGATENNQSTNKSPIYLGRNNISLLSEDKRLKSKLSLKSLKNCETDEFLEILKNCGLTYDKYLKMSQKPQNEKFSEIIEMFIKLLLDKNLSIEVLEKENSNLTVKNFELNKANMNLFTINNQMKNSNSISNSKTQNDSIENNTSNITPNRNLAIKSLITYEKVIEKELKENKNGNEDSSDMVENETIKKIQNSLGKSFHSSGGDGDEVEDEENEEEEDSNIQNGTEFISTIIKNSEAEQETQSVQVNKSEEFEFSSVSYKNTNTNKNETLEYDANCINGK